ncbi:MAG: hypothetical protein ABMA01_19960, partial [Chthoniobacteraceae bacterium]
MPMRFLHFLFAALTLISPLGAAIKSGDDKSPAVSQPAAPEGKSATAAEPAGPVFVFPFKDEVSPPIFAFLRRSLKAAERAGASAFILDMDTPGGRLDVTLEIFELLHKTKIPVITFVNPHAISAGALVSLATKKIYMRPDATIGAAAVVSGEGADLQTTMKSTVDSFMTAKMRGVSEENGHNPDIAEAFILIEKELRVGDTLVDSKDTLLSLNGREAAKLYDGKPLLATGLVETLDDLLKAEGLTGAVTR